jgi:putative transposase
LKDDEKFEWQKSFYDRIIRNEKELYQIRKYIQENPLRWEIEKDNPENLIM